MHLRNIRRKLVGNILVNISPSNIFFTILLPARFHQNCEASFGRREYYWVNAQSILQASGRDLR